EGLGHDHSSGAGRPQGIEVTTIGEKRNRAPVRDGQGRNAFDQGAALPPYQLAAEIGDETGDGERLARSVEADIGHGSPVRAYCCGCAGGVMRPKLSDGSCWSRRWMTNSVMSIAGLATNTASRSSNRPH